MDEPNIQKNLAALQKKVQRYTKQYHRPEGSVQLLAVSKTKPVQSLIAAYQYGQRHFGENYVQEALVKLNKLSAYAIVWHFIGLIQSNKAKAIAQNFDWVHSVCGIKTAKKLNQFRPPERGKLNTCIQVNLENAPGKSGIAPKDVFVLVEAILMQPLLDLRGLMLLPAQKESPEEQYQVFHQLSELKDQINQRFQLKLDTLSMGMSYDYEMAIRAGSTIIRVGQTIFGKRA